MTVHPLVVFTARAEARAMLVYAGMYHQADAAIDALLDDAWESGLVDSVGESALFAIIRKVFSKYEDGVRENERSE